MKKLFTMAIVVLGIAFANAQTEKGKILLEVNTNISSGSQTSNTGISFTSIKVGDISTSVLGLGAEAGYFVMDDLAIKLGLGYTKVEDIDGIFNYKLGAKYYISKQFPVQVDYSGTSLENGGSFLGLQAGYSYFLGDNLSIEPNVRYNVGLGDADGVKAFQFNVGFAVFL